MKLLKRFLKVLLLILGLVLITAIFTLSIDAFSTRYLKLGNHDSLNNTTYLISGVNLIPMHKDTILMDKTVYIKDGLIQNISDNFTVEGIEVIDAKGKYLLPGLIDMHVHVSDRYELGLYLSNGVTAVRNLWGMPMHLRIKEDVNNNDIISPMFFTSGPKLTGTEFIGDDNINLATANDARKKVASYKNRGYDFIKTYYGLDEELFDAVIEQAEKSDMEIAAHPSQKVPFSYHLNPQIKSIEHAEEIVQQPLQFDLDTVKLKPIINNIGLSKHTSYCPTIVVFNNIYQMMLNDSILDSEPLGYMNPLIKKLDSKKQFERWYNAKQQNSGEIDRIKKQHDFHLTIVSELHKADVPIICGTDSGIGVTLPGFSIHQELAFYKEAGLSNYEVLRTATFNASKTHSIMNGLGTIEEGKIANLLLVNTNPLEDLSALKRPSVVFIKGRKLNRNLLDTFEEKAKNRKNLMATGLRYLENLLIEK